MKFSYFNEGNNGLGLRTVGLGITGFVSTIAPRLSAFIGRQILMKPYGKRHYEDCAITPVKRINLPTSMGHAHVNLFGQGEQVIIISHGWADSSQSFKQMIQSLTEQGYLVAAVDHIGHGKSSGAHSHLLSFIETMELLIGHFYEERIAVKGIIGHSMGAVATLNLPRHLLEDKKIILISSPIRFFDLMFEKVEQVGISRKLLIRTLESIAKKYGRAWQQLSLKHQRNKLSLDLTFVHDINDKFAPFDDIEQYLQTEKNRLITTEGLGHTRILGDTHVINSISAVLAT